MRANFVTRKTIIFLTICLLNAPCQWVGNPSYRDRENRNSGLQFRPTMYAVMERDPPASSELEEIVPKPSGRWWLDSLAKMLHIHPLHMTKYVREVSIPSSESLNFASSPQTVHFPRLYKKSVGDSIALPAFDQVSAVHRMRELLASYRRWFSPKQWKQFLQKSPNPRKRRSEEDVHLELLESAVTAVRAALTECQYQFRNERWNCSEVLTDPNALFGNILLKGIPETAYVYALVSASLVRTIAEACLTNLRNCPCNNRGREEAENEVVPHSDWQWQGCDHNIHYGRRFSRNLLDPMEGGGFHIRFLMNLHNYKVGRRVVSGNMHKYCRCHGTSGSCTLKTCYRKTPTMRLIGNELRAKYDKATQVMRDNTLPTSWGVPEPRGYNRQPIVHFNRFYSQRTLREVDQHSLLYRGTPRLPSLIKVGPDAQGFHSSGRDLRPTTEELVFYEEPARGLFCSANAHLHIQGTKGRLCSSNSTGLTELGGCGQLCCNRGHTTRHYYALENCECKFVWCCRVECQKCLVLKTEETCM